MELAIEDRSDHLSAKLMELVVNPQLHDIRLDYFFIQGIVVGESLRQVLDNRAG